MKKGVSAVYIAFILFSLVLCLAFIQAANEQAQKRTNVSENGSQYQYEIREVKKLSEEEKSEITQNQNRLNIQNRLNQTECPNNCSCDGSTTRCEYFDPERNQTKRELTIHAGNSNNTIIQVKETNASTRVQLYKENGRIFGIFGNETKEIILPDEIQERIEARINLRLQNGSMNLTLNEQGEYQLEAKKRARLFFIIPVQEKFNANINAETGEIIRERNSWWGFLARDIKEE